MARSLLRRLTAPFRSRPRAADRDGRAGDAPATPAMHAEARQMARLIAQYLREAEAEVEVEAEKAKAKEKEKPKDGSNDRSNTRREAVRAAKAAARKAARTFDVVSFPKSGRTWLRVMLDDLKLPANYTHDGSGHSIVGHVEELRPASDEFAGKTVIFLYRDPRDTVVSGYFQASKRVNTYAGSISDFVRDPRHGIEKIARFNMAWLERGPTLCKFLPVTYEELRADTAPTLARIVAFIGADRDEAALRAAIEDAEFEKMREKEASGELGERYGKALLPADKDDPASFKVRAGIVGGFHNHLSEDDVAACEAILQRLGYPLERHMPGGA